MECVEKALPNFCEYGKRVTAQLSDNEKMMASQSFLLSNYNQIYKALQTLGIDLALSELCT